MIKERLKINEKYLEVSFVLLCFFIYFTWSLMQPFDSCPDEAMRYDIPKFIFQHGALPLGQDPTIRNYGYGISYGFSSLLPAIIGSVFMKCVSLFTVNQFALLIGARLVSVLASTGTVIVLIKLSKLLFSKSTAWLFVILVSLLPQFVFVSSYVNNDAMAIFSTALIVYFWVVGSKTRWNLKSCIGLSVAISICLLSYLNAYGFVLMSIFWFICSSLINNNEPHKFKKMLKKAALILSIVFVLAGWWFIRNLVLYGDVFALRISSYYSELYAIDGMKPSKRGTPHNLGYSITYMLFQQKWLEQSYLTFIGEFGYMSIALKKWMYWIYSGVFFTGFLGLIIWAVKKFKSKKSSYDIKKVVLYICMAITAMIPVLLSGYYSYFSDYQPQGRYWLSMLIPYMFIVGKGINAVADHMRSLKDKFLYCIILAVFLIIFACSFQLIPQNYL